MLSCSTLNDMFSTFQWGNLFMQYVHVTAPSAFFQRSDGAHSISTVPSSSCLAATGFITSALPALLIPAKLSQFTESCSVVYVGRQFSFLTGIRVTRGSCLYFDGATTRRFALVAVKKCGSNNHQWPWEKYTERKMGTENKREKTKSH